MHRSNGIVNNNIIVDSLIETFHHLSRQLTSNSLHFFFSMLHSYHKTVDIIIADYVIIMDTISSIISRLILIDIYENRGVYIVPIHIRNSIIHRDVTKRTCGSNLLQPRIIFYDSIRSKYIKRTGTWYRRQKLAQ